MGCKDIEIIKSEFVEKTQFLYILRGGGLKLAKNCENSGFVKKIKSKLLKDNSGRCATK